MGGFERVHYGFCEFVIVDFDCRYDGGGTRCRARKQGARYVPVVWHSSLGLVVVFEFLLFESYLAIWSKVLLHRAA